MLAQGVEGFVEKFFVAQKQTLNVLSTKGLCEAVTRYIDRNDTDALEDIFRCVIVAKKGIKLVDLII